MRSQLDCLRTLSGKRASVLGVLAICLALVVCLRLLSGPSSAAGSHTNAQKVHIPEPGAHTREREPFAWPIATARNPFHRPHDGVTAAAPDIDALARERLTLEGTVLGRSPGARINGVLVHEGDVIEGFTVRRIEGFGVVLEKDGVQVELRVDRS